MEKHFILLTACLALILASYSKSETPKSPAGTPPAKTITPSAADQVKQPAATPTAQPIKSKIDACALLTSKEIESIQGEPLKETKASGNFDGTLAVSQCYFVLPNFTNSIVLTVTQKGDGPGARDPKQVWQETFHRDKDKDKEREEKKKKKPPPEKIADLGDEAFWTGSRVGGALYALKGNSYIRISVGGASDQAAKIKKSKALAKMVLKRLKKMTKPE